MTSLTTVRLPLPWDEFGLPNPFRGAVTTLTTGQPAWRWDREAPGLGIPECEEAVGGGVEGWDVDHIVVMVPEIDQTVETMAAAGVAPRLEMKVAGRPTALFRAGPVIECIESPVRAPALYGIALVTEEPLEVVVLRWRAMGRDVGDPRPAVQPGRRIFVVRSVEAGFAVMSPDRAVDGTRQVH